LALFDLSGINKSPARLDPDKWRATNAAHLQNLDDESFLERAIAFLPQPPSPAQREMLRRAAPQLKARMQLLSDLPNAAAYLLASRPFDLTGKAGKPLRKEGVSDLLSSLHERLAQTEDWSAITLEALLQSFAEERGIGFGQVGPPLRAVLTGGHPAPSLGETLEALGREEALSRINEGAADPATKV
ncbi:MAG: glutamate--tRNA ligase, partial [Parvularcula sp.]|nr:glutamate--tRNA ligase [Parvularcula sp.]